MIALLLVLQQGPTVDVEVGCTGSVFPDAWTRVWVTLQNPGADLDGELRVRATGGIGHPSELRRPVTLATKGKRLLSWDLFLERGEDEVVAELFDGKGQVVAERRVPLLFLPHRPATVMLVGCSPTAFDDEKIAAGRLKPELLPDRLPPLLAADAIVFAEPVPLEAEQEEVLERWVMRGGTLVFSAGRLPAAASRRLWRELGPASITGMENLNDGTRALAIARAVPRPGARPFGSILGRPAGFRWERGLGSVVLLTLPFDADGFDRLLAPGVLREEVLPTVLLPEDPTRIQPLGNPGPIGEDLRTLREKIQPQDRGLGLPDLVFGAFFAGVYFILIGPGWWLLRRRRLGWIPFAVATAAAALLGLAWADFFSSRPSRLAHRVLVGPGAVEGHSWLRAGSPARYRLSVDGALGVVPGQYALAAFERVHPPIHGAEGQLEVALPALGERAVVWARALGKDEGLRARWTDATQSILEIRNPGRGPAAGLMLVRREGVVELPDLEAGERCVLSPADFAALGWKDLGRREEVNRWTLGEFSGGRKALFLSSFLAHAVPRMTEREAYGLRGADLSALLARGQEFLVGWVEVAAPSVEPGATVETWALARALVEAP
jgi:hypothetical protein